MQYLKQLWSSLANFTFMTIIYDAPVVRTVEWVRATGTDSRSA